MGRISDSNAAVSASVLHTTGKLALVGGEDIIPFIDKLLPLVIENLQDQSSPMKREVTVSFIYFIKIILTIFRYVH